MTEAKKLRINGAKKRLEARLKLSDAELIKTAKRFKGKENISKEELIAYKEYLQKELTRLASLHLG